MVEDIHWKTISRFKSYDFVAKWYRKAHERSASAAKVRQINACFAHGREYFRNAADSEMNVKPLLLYYGVLSCCRGVTLANDPQKNEGNSPPPLLLRSLNHSLSFFSEAIFRDCHHAYGAPIRIAAISTSSTASCSCASRSQLQSDMLGSDTRSPPVHNEVHPPIITPL